MFDLRSMGLTTATSPNRPGFRHNRFLWCLVAGYLMLWLALAIAPHNRFDWFLENILVFAAAALLVLTYRAFVFSDLSYGLIALFLAVHALGAHYTYSLTPIGFQLQDLFGLARNPYDRLIHFGFGLLLAYPALELCLRLPRPRPPVWAYLFALALIVALSALYEMLEWSAAMVLEPEDALAFLGTQGDVFDAQKDAALAMIGAVITLSLAGCLGATKGRAGIGD